MRTQSKAWTGLSLVVAWSLLVVGCLGKGTSQPPKFYVLSPMAAQGGVTVSGTGSLSVGVGPVVIPPHLDRPQIVTRATTNEVHLSEFAQWAEPLGDGIPNAIVENLVALLGTNRVIRLPQRVTMPLDYQAAIQVIRLDAGADGAARLEARWTIVGRDDNKNRVTRTSAYTEAIGGENADALVAAQSRLLSQLSKEIAEAISRLHASGS
jgi:uncharacterized lipoprotein YmbA